MARLVIFDDQVRAIDLPDHAVVIGRSLRADIPIRDPILSRKHCRIAPIAPRPSSKRNGGGSGPRFRFEDLESANGSWVNGKRVDRAKIECDDVLEIGTTVMVVLDTDTWQRGDGLARLRNPVKAQELVQRIHRQTRQSREKRPGSQDEGGTDAGERAAAAGRPPITPERTDEAFVRWAQGELRGSPLLAELLEQELGRQVIAAIVQRVPGLRGALEGALDRVFVPESFQGGPDAFRAAVRIAVRDALASIGLDVGVAGRGREPAAEEAS